MSCRGNGTKLQRAYIVTAGMSYEQVECSAAELNIEMMVALAARFN